VSQNLHLKGKIMNSTVTKSLAHVTLTIALIAVTNVSLAFAAPDLGGPGSPGAVHQTNAADCGATNSGVRLLERIGTQFVRGDDLTGAGSPAPDWVPEAR